MAKSVEEELESVVIALLDGGADPVLVASS